MSRDIFKDLFPNTDHLLRPSQFVNVALASAIQNGANTSSSSRRMIGIDLFSTNSLLQICLNRFPLFH